MCVYHIPYQGIINCVLNPVSRSKRYIKWTTLPTRPLELIPCVLQSVKTPLFAVVVNSSFLLACAKEDAVF